MRPLMGCNCSAIFRRLPVEKLNTGKLKFVWSNSAPHARPTQPIGRSIERSGCGAGYRVGSRVVPIPTKNYRAARSRVNIALSRELVRAPVACLPPAARLSGYHHFTIVTG